MKKGSPIQPLLKLLLTKYRTDPEGFRAYLPEVAETLDAMAPAPRSSRNPFGLTEHERAHRQRALQEVLERQERSAQSRENALRGLEHAAVLIEDGSLPPEVGHETLVRLLKVATNTSPGSVKAPTVITVQEGQADKIVHRIPLVRGIVLSLTWDMRLVSIAISPRKVKERRKALRFVGIAQDPARDVALRHDEYLGGREPHAAP